MLHCLYSFNTMYCFRESIDWKKKYQNLARVDQTVIMSRVPVTRRTASSTAYTDVPPKCACPQLRNPIQLPRRQKKSLNGTWTFPKTPQLSAAHSVHRLRRHVHVYARPPPHDDWCHARFWKSWDYTRGEHGVPVRDLEGGFSYGYRYQWVFLDSSFACTVNRFPIKAPLQWTVEFVVS